MPRKPKSNVTKWVLWGTLFNLIGIPLVSFLVWLFVSALHANETLATRRDVDDVKIAAAKYTDEKIEVVRKEAESIRKDAYEHSDANRKDMALAQAQSNSEIQKVLIENTTKMNMVLEGMKTLETWQREQTRFKK